MKKLICAVALALAAGCGGDSTGPKVDLTGTWTYSATNLNVSGVNCSISGVTMTIVATGNTFTGAVAPGGTLTCTSPAGTDVEPLGGDIIANGTISGNAIQFDIGNSDFHNAGTLSGNSISGTVTVHVDDSGVVFNLVGNFTAVKH